jgi:hypothetical protein
MDDLCRNKDTRPLSASPPAHVRHAAPGVLPNVPQEPVVCEGSFVHGRLTHELWEDARGWQFRPAGRL